MSVIDESAAPPDRASSEVPTKPPSLRRNRDFVLLWSGAAVSFFGSRVSAIAYSLVVLWSTGSATAAGLVTTAALLPNLLVQLPAGALVDRWDRRKVMVFCDLGRLLLIASVAVAVFFGKIWLPQLMVVAFAEASLMVFYRLAEHAAVRNVVHPDQIGTAMAGNEARGQAAGLLGQPAGTFLFAATRWLPFGFTAIAHLLSLITLLFIRRDLQTGRSNNPYPMLLKVKEGFTWVWSQKYLRRALGLIAGSNVLFQVLTLALIVIVLQEGGSPATVGFIIAANGIGGMIGALTSGLWMRYLSIRRIIMVVNTAWAVLMPLVAFAHNPVALAALYFGMVYFAGVGNVAGLVYQMKTTPDEMQGRVGSIATLLASGANALGALAGGFMLDAWGTRNALLVVGAVMLSLTLLAYFWFGGPRAKRIEQEMGAGVELTRTR